MGRTDRYFKTVEGVGAVLTYKKDIVISDFKHNSPQSITMTHLANEQVKISIYKNQGKEELVLFIGDDVPTAAVKLFELPDQGDRTNMSFSGFMFDDKSVPNAYGELTYFK